MNTITKIICLIYVSFIFAGCGSSIGNSNLNSPLIVPPSDSAPVAAAPTIAALSDKYSNQATPISVDLVVADADTNLSCTSHISKISLNLALVPLANIVISGTAPNCVATITPAVNQSGVSTITFTVSDGALSTSSSFTLTATINWNSYLGSQYNLKSWSTAARDVSSAHQYGYDAAAIDQTASYNDFVTNVVAMVQSNVLTSSAFTAQVGGIGSGRNLAAMTAYMDSIELDGGLAARDAYKKRAKAIAEIPGTQDKFYWQVGNEINTDQMSENLHLWNNDSVAPSMHDVSTIPFLVEYFIAPAALGIQEASFEVYGDSNIIRIMLGSIAVASSPNAQAFLNAILDYTVVGTYAPALAGKKVYEIVDTVSIHYAMAGAGTTWKTNLDDFLTRRMGVGRIKRIMSTEEVGINAANGNLGMQSALRSISRYMHWWGINNISPDTSRVFFYGHGAGTVKIDDEMPILNSFIGANPLIEVSGDGISQVVASTNIEKYEFDAGTINNPTKKRVFIAYTNDFLSGTITDISFYEPTWTSITVVAFKYGGTPAGKIILNPTITSNSGTHTIDFGTPLAIDAQDAILLMIDGN